MKKALALAVIAIAALAVAQRDPLSGNVGKKIPAFSMKDIKGKTLTNKSLEGKVVLLDFWASWCGPCKQASPAMERLHKKYAKQGLVVIGANAMDQGSTTVAPKYAKDNNFSFTFTSKNDDLANKLGIASIPAFVIVDKKGVVRHVQTGWSPSLEASFESTIKSLLKG